MGDTGLTLQEFRAVLRLDLKDSGALWSDAELDRSVQRAVEDMSRSIPLEQVYEHTLDFDVTDEEVTMPAAASATAIIGATTLVGVTSLDRFTIADTTPEVPRRLTVTLTDATPTITVFNLIIRGTDQNGNYIEEKWFRKDLVTTVAKQGELYFKTVVEVELHALGGGSMVGNTVSIGTGNAYDSYVFMANKPIKPESEKVYSAASSGTLFVRDTDYTIDYVNGAIKYISGGSMALGIKYYVNYTKSELGIDLSAILPVMTRVTKVEYPVDKVPQQFVAFSIWDKFMYIGSPRAGESQTSLTDKEHVAIYHEREQMPPSQHSPGSYPAYLDQVITIGAGAYALLMEALQYEQQAVTDLASLRTELGLTTAVHTLADTALDKAAVLLTATTGKIDLALTKVALYLETSGTTDNAKDVLSNITDDEAKLRTAIDTAVQAMNTYLDEVDTTDLGQATVGAEGLLETGDDTINKLNDGGPTVPERYVDYARTRVAIAQARTQAALGYAQEIQMRLSNLRTYVEEAGGWMHMGETFLAEASQLIGQVNGCIAEASTRIATVDRYIAEAAQYQEAANTDMVLSDRFRAEGQIRLAEFHAILTNKAEYRKRVVSVPVRQPA